MDSFNCEDYCCDMQFKNVLDRFGLLVGDHSEDPDMWSSLKFALDSYLMTSEELEDFLTSFLSQRQFRSIYNAGAKLELGPHKGIAGPGGIDSPFGLLCAISKRFQVEIYVVCGALPFKALHNECKLLKINFVDQQVREKVVIGCVGLQTFHRLKLTESITATVSRLNPVSVPIDVDYISSYISDEESDDSSDEEEMGQANDNQMSLAEYVGYLDEETGQLDHTVYNRDHCFGFRLKYGVGLEIAFHI